MEERKKLLDELSNELLKVNNELLTQIIRLIKHVNIENRTPEGYYIPEYDITVIFSTTNDDKSLAVTGFYYGKPDSRHDKLRDCDWVADLDLD